MTRNGWMRAFWQVLGDLMEVPDRIENVRAPRNFDGAYAVILLNHIGREDDEEDPFFPFVGPAPTLPESPSPQQFTFERTASPVAAAEVVAKKLREFATHRADPTERR